MTTEVDRRVIAGIRGCKDSTYLEGAACTNRCEYFRTCKIKRKPLLVNTINMRGDKDDFVEIKRRSVFFDIKEFKIWHSGHADYVLFNPDSEINGQFDDELLR